MTDFSADVVLKEFVATIGTMAEFPQDVPRGTHSPWM
jgi:hypothetical protein